VVIILPVEVKGPLPVRRREEGGGRSEATEGVRGI
jgi:hypothetical protein